LFTASVEQSLILMLTRRRSPAPTCSASRWRSVASDRWIHSGLDDLRFGPGRISRPKRSNIRGAAFWTASRQLRVGRYSRISTPTPYRAPAPRNRRKLAIDCRFAASFASTPTRSRFLAARFRRKVQDYFDF